MKKLIFILTLILTCHSVLASVLPNNCIAVNSAIELSMRRAMFSELGVDKSDIVEDNTRLELIANNPLSSQQANMLAQQDFDKESHFNLVNIGEYMEMYLQSNPRNLIIKFHYFNNKNQENTFIASAIADDNECWNVIKYTTLKREF